MLAVLILPMHVPGFFLCVCAVLWGAQERTPLLENLHFLKAHYMYYHNPL